MLNLFLNLLGGTVKDWIKTRSEISNKKALARIENVSKGIPGYSDEYLILVWSYPVVAAFIPPLQFSAKAGFEFLHTLPDWYVGGFISISFAVFGIDKLFKWKK